MDDARFLSLLDSGRFVALLLVAIGVAGEFVGDWLARPVQRRIEQAKNEEIARLNKEAGEARENAASAIQSAASATERTKALEVDAAKQQERAARAEMDLLRLKKQATPRRLSVEQQAKLSEVVSRFSRAPISLDLISVGGQETVDLANDIDAAIRKTGTPIPNRNLLIDQSFVGVLIRYGSRRIPEANALGDFFIESGLAPKPAPGQESSNPEELTILVGSKPN